MKNFYLTQALMITHDCVDTSLPINEELWLMLVSLTPSPLS